jgi:hypothetical protein
MNSSEGYRIHQPLMRGIPRGSRGSQTQSGLGAGALCHEALSRQIQTVLQCPQACPLISPVAMSRKPKSL